MVKFIQKKVSCREALDLPVPALSGKPVVYVAAAALLDRDDRILLAQRPEGKAMAGLWEFPGGKIDAGETPEYALMRELDEELGVVTRPCCFTPIAFASHEYGTFHLVMPLFACRVWKGTVTSREGQAFKWVSAQDLREYPMPEADLPLIEPIQNFI